MPLTSVRHVKDGDEEYDSLMFVCPGCAATREGYEGLHMLPVTPTTKKPFWTWDDNLDAPTLSPSILTRLDWDGTEIVCHSYLRAGVFEFLGDCTHPLVGQHVPLPPLPEWADK